MVHAAQVAGAQVSITVRQDPRVKAAFASIADDGWTPIKYTDAVFDEQAKVWTSRAEVTEVPFTAFTSRPAAQQVTGRLVVRRIPDFNPKQPAEQAGLFDLWRFHAFFTTTPTGVADTVAADKIHRHHAIIENVHADLKHAALAHLPSGKFTANAAWLVLACIAFSLTRAAATVSGDKAGKVQHRHHPPHPDQRPRPDGDLGSPRHLALADQLALETGLGPAICAHLRATGRRPELTKPDEQHPQNPPGTTDARADRPISDAHKPSRPTHRRAPIAGLTSVDRG